MTIRDFNTVFKANCSSDGKLRVHKENDRWFWKYENGDMHDYESETVCVYDMLKNLHSELSGAGFPEYKMLDYDDFNIGVIVRIEDDIFRAYFGEIGIFAIIANDIETAYNNFWNIISHAHEYQSVIDSFEKKNCEYAIAC